MRQSKLPTSEKKRVHEEEEILLDLVEDDHPKAAAAKARLREFNSAMDSPRVPKRSPAFRSAPATQSTSWRKESTSEAMESTPAPKESAPQEGVEPTRDGEKTASLARLERHISQRYNAKLNTLPGLRVLLLHTLSRVNHLETLSQQIIQMLVKQNVLPTASIAADWSFPRITTEEEYREFQRRIENDVAYKKQCVGLSVHIENNK